MKANLADIKERKRRLLSDFLSIEQTEENRTVNPNPYVDRIIEALAFFSGNIQAEVDTYKKQLETDIINQHLPFLLEDFPSTIILQLKSKLNTLKKDNLCKKSSRSLMLETKTDAKIQFQFYRDPNFVPYQIKSSYFLEEDKRSLAYPLFCIDIEPVVDSQSALNYAVQSLSFYLNAEEREALDLYFLLNHITVLELWAGGKRQAYIPNPKIAVLQDLKSDFKFEDYPRSFEEYRWLIDYFHFIEKCFFIEIKDLTLPVKECFTLKCQFEKRACLHIKDKTRLENKMQLNCFPLLNVFTAPAEPFYLSDAKLSYEVVLDHTKPDKQKPFRLAEAQLCNEKGEYRTLQAGECQYFEKKLHFPVDFQAKNHLVSSVFWVHQSNVPFEALAIAGKSIEGQYLEQQQEWIVRRVASPLRPNASMANQALSRLPEWNQPIQQLLNSLDFFKRLLLKMVFLFKGKEADQLRHQRMINAIQAIHTQEKIAWHSGKPQSTYCCEMVLEETSVALPERFLWGQCIAHFIQARLPLGQVLVFKLNTGLHEILEYPLLDIV